LPSREEEQELLIFPVPAGIFFMGTKNIYYFIYKGNEKAPVFPAP
jgi:hypothetical protein